MSIYYYKNKKGDSLYNNLSISANEVLAQLSKDRVSNFES